MAKIHKCPACGENYRGDYPTHAASTKKQLHIEYRKRKAKSKSSNKSNGSKGYCSVNPCPFRK